MNRRHALKLALAGFLAGPTLAADPSLPGRARILKVGTATDSLVSNWSFEWPPLGPVQIVSASPGGSDTILVAGYTLEELKTIACTHAGWRNERKP